MISAVLFISFFIFLILGVPIAICLGLSSVCAILYSGTSLTIVATNMYAGIRTAPRAATVAGPEPEIAPKKHATITHTMAIPPFLWPTQVSTKLISRLELSLIHI